jgi:hypothetical protein
MDNLPNLSGVHAAIQQALNDLIADGVATDDVIEAALTVAVTGKMTAHGARATSDALAIVARYLSDQADEQERTTQSEKSGRYGH